MDCLAQILSSNDWEMHETAVNAIVGLCCENGFLLACECDGRSNTSSTYQNNLFIWQDSASSVNITSYSYNGNLSYYDCHLIIYTIVRDGQRRKIKIIDNVYVPQYMFAYFARINIKQRF